MHIPKCIYLVSFQQAFSLLPFFSFAITSNVTFLPPTHYAHVWEVPEDIHGYGFISEKAMATHSSTLAWKIPWLEEPGGLQSMRSQRVGHDWSDLAAAAAWVHLNRKTTHPHFRRWSAGAHQRGRTSLSSHHLHSSHIPIIFQTCSVSLLCF